MFRCGHLLQTLQILKHECFIQIFNSAAQKIYKIIIGSRWAPGISVTKSVSNLMWNMVTCEVHPWLFGYKTSYLPLFILFLTFVYILFGPVRSQGLCSDHRFLCSFFFSQSEELATFEESSLRCSWDPVLLRMDWHIDRQPENIKPLATMPTRREKWTQQYWVHNVQVR